MKIRPQVKPASKGADEGWAVLSTLISGFVVFGGIGWLLDRWWDTHLMVPIGLIVGMALSIYAVVMQFGRPDAASGDAVSNAQKAGPAAQSASVATVLRTAWSHGVPYYRCSGAGLSGVGVRAPRHASRDVRPRARDAHPCRLQGHARLTAAPTWA